MLSPLSLALSVLLLAGSAWGVEDDSLGLIQLGLGTHQAPAELAELFSQFDLDHSGTLQQNELTEYLRHHWSPDVTPAQVRFMIRKSDKNIDWAISLEEFVGCVADAVACGKEPPPSPVAPQAGGIAAPAGSDSATVLAEKTPGNGITILGGFLPPEWVAAFKPERGWQDEVKECTDFDREILKTQGFTVQSQGGAATADAEPSVDPVHLQTLLIGGAWAQTLLLPTACKEALSRATSVDRPAHAQCLMESLNITLPCARCSADYLHNMVHACAALCTRSLNSRSCVKCSNPRRLLECVGGTPKQSSLGADLLKIRGAGSLIEQEEPEEPEEADALLSGKNSEEENMENLDALQQDFLREAEEQASAEGTRGRRAKRASLHRQDSVPEVEVAQAAEQRAPAQSATGQTAMEAAEEMPLGELQDEGAEDQRREQ